jgi:hypothetical protein
MIGRRKIETMIVPWELLERGIIKRPTKDEGYQGVENGLRR